MRMRERDTMTGRHGTVRPPAVAGLFYPAAASELAARLDDVLGRRASHRDASDETHPPKVLIVPLAGSVFSGSVAGLGYARLGPLRTSITRVVLIGPAHRFALRGPALASAAGFATPLGAVAIDE
ncbi:MAG: AmmeMemoRadiSam system protein B, partial [Alphaproteobacteria bacterium]|nr:AmmeMemoRadiSam system protein B [Alphaproteobacteria bacterium]